MAIPEAGPETGSPRYSTAPAEGSSRPAMTRSNVDFPEPDRPRSPTISPGRSVRFTFSSTTSSSPSGLRKDLHTPCTSSSGARLSAGATAFTTISFGPASADAELTLAARIQRTPEHPVERHYEQAQHHGAQHGALEVTRTGRFEDIGTEPMRGELLVAPVHHLGNDARVPRAARSGDRTGDIERKHGRQRESFPPQPAAHPEVLARIAQVRCDRRGADDHVEQNVPLGAEDHQWAEPDVRRELQHHDRRHHDREQQIGGEGGEEL